MSTNTNDDRTTPGAAWMTVRDLAAHLGVSAATVYAWRHAGTGPAAVRLGGRPRYRHEDVNAWLAARVEGDRR